MTMHSALAAVVITIALITPPRQGEAPRATRLEFYSWVQAEKLLQPDTVVVIPLGAALKEHGPHLRLRNDLILAEYFTGRVEAALPVVITPPLTYHFYPAFLEYPGSTSLTLETSRDSTVQIVRSLARYGPKRFYVLNTGVSTSRSLEPAAALLAQDGILLRYTDFSAAATRAAESVKQQATGSHADELETSMMLYIDETSVDMRLAVKDINPASTPFRLNRQSGGTGTHSPSGVWGDATLATREKGRVIVEGVAATILRDIEALRTAALPAGAPAPAVDSSRPAGSSPEGAPEPGACLPGVERDIKRVEAAFNTFWLQRDPIAFGSLWSEQGDLVHGDGTIERSRRTITENRTIQFKAPEYKSARLSLAFTTIRCINTSVAVVDAKWELRDVVDAAGKPLPRAEGFATLVLMGGGGRWGIEAYRYSTKPGAPSGPTLLKKPGYPDK